MPKVLDGSVTVGDWLIGEEIPVHVLLVFTVDTSPCRDGFILKRCLTTRWASYRGRDGAKTGVGIIPVPGEGKNRSHGFTNFMP